MREVSHSVPGAQQFFRMDTWGYFHYKGKCIFVQNMYSEYQGVTHKLELARSKHKEQPRSSPFTSTAWPNETLHTGVSGQSRKSSDFLCKQYLCPCLSFHPEACLIHQLFRMNSNAYKNCHIPPRQVVPSHVSVVRFHHECVRPNPVTSSPLEGFRSFSAPFVRAALHMSS